MLAPLIALAAVPVAPATSETPAAPSAIEKSVKPERTGPDAFFASSEVRTRGSVRIGGRKIGYQAIAGTIVVHAKDWSDTDWLEARAVEADKADDPKPEASMFYVAYFRDGVPTRTRPITFAFNGGPGSSSIWLHMGAFGPMRVETRDPGHTSAPYRLTPNDKSLLDVSDLVFIDAPGTGFSRIAGKDKDKAFFGVDQDIDAFAQFITAFLSRYNRWGSPKYVMGESYGTMRGAGLALALQNRDVDLNGLILLSDILNWDLVPDDPKLNPSIDLPYVVALPTYAATAWYHNRIKRPAGSLQDFLAEVERFATTEYLAALVKGNDLPADERQRMAERLSAYTGLPVSYLLKTDLRIAYGAFQRELLGSQNQTTGTLDTRYTGATIDPIGKLADWDPQSSALSAAYVATYNDYVRGSLRFGNGVEFKPGISIYEDWDYRHKPPGSSRSMIALPNVLPDLAVAMKQNPAMRVQVHGGYFDVSTPYFAGKFELRHLPVGPELQRHIDFHYYEAGHMIFAHPRSFETLRANVGRFIAETSAPR
jgi:carboxypeptidase C (cathepsin A)